MADDRHDSSLHLFYPKRQSTLSVVFFPGSVCFRAQVLGTLFGFHNGIAFVLSLYEITQDLVMTGLTRFCLAILKTFELAFGVAIGLWLAKFGGPSRFDGLDVNNNCSNLSNSVDPVWYCFIYPLLSIGALMHLRTATIHWPICLVTQLLAVKSQYLLSFVWKQPIFVSNFVPALVATITAHILIVLFNKYNLTEMSIAPTAFLMKKLDRRRDIKQSIQEVATKPSWMNPNGSVVSTSRGQKRRSSVIRFVDHGWADQGRHGYRRNDKFQYQLGDLWFCLAPSLYLLVPGAAIWNISFFSIVESSTQDIKAHDGGSSFQTLVSAVFVVGMGLVMGVRVALAVLWAVHEYHRKSKRNTRDENGFK